MPYTAEHRHLDGIAPCRYPWAIHSFRWHSRYCLVMFCPLLPGDRTVAGEGVHLIDARRSP